MSKRKLDVVYLLAASYARGGVKVQIEHANLLARRGHRVRIVAAGPPPDWIDLEVPWLEEKGGRLGSRLPPCDLVVFSFYEQAFLVAEATLAAGAVPIYFVQGDEIVFGDPEDEKDEKKRASITAAQASLRLPYPILTVSSAAADRIEELGAAKTAVVPNGVDRKIFHPRPRPEDPGAPRVLSVGSELARFKGVVEICGALMKLCRDGVPFVFVRASPLPDAIGELPFPVEFHREPTQSRLAELYSGADLFVGASHAESFYLPPLEAMACGTAVACSDLPSVRDYAEPERDFLPFPPGDLPAMTRQIRRALRYPALRRRLAESGLRVAERMDWERLAPRLEAYLGEQLGRKEETHRALRSELDRPTVEWRIEPDG